MRRTKKLLCMVLAFALGVALQPAQTFAMEENVEQLTVTPLAELTLEENTEGVFGGLNDMEGNPNGRAVILYECAIRMTYEPANLYVEFMTNCSDIASEIGVKDVKVQEQNGIFWNTIATSVGASAKNQTIFLGGCDCNSVVKGATYRVKCVHYAYVNGVYYSLENVTDGHKFV